MFKFIIIGDTGNPIHHFRGWQIMPSTPVHRSPFQTKTLSYNRSLIWSQNDHSGRQNSQTTNLGYCKYNKI
jgi:hypothetical protein